MESEIGLRIRALGQGAHLCLTSGDAGETVAALILQCRAGWERGERSLYIGTRAGAGALQSALAAAGVDVPAALASGSFEALTADAIPVPGGPFDPPAMAALLLQKEARALADGFAGLRTAADMSWVLERSVTPQQLVEFESLMDAALADSRTVALCCYDRSRFDPAQIERVIPAHPVVLIGGHFCLNPYYEPPALLGAAASLPDEVAARRVEWRLRHLHQVREAQRHRERIEEALRHSEERFRQAFVHAATGIEIFSPEGRFLQVNAAYCAMTGYTENELLGSSYEQVTHPDDLDECRKLVAELAAGVIPSFTREKRYLKKGGAVVWHLTSVSLVRDREGRPFNFIALAEDVTERKRLEAEATAQAARLRALARRVSAVQEEERGRLARELHDEIGQALTVIGLNIQALLSDGQAPPHARLEDSLDIVRRTTDRVRALSLNLRPSLLDDFGLIPALEALFERQAERAGIAAHFQVSPPYLVVSPDLANACYRVAQEALNNVLRHSQARNVWLRLRQQGAEVRLLVRDDGLGFDPETTRAGTAAGRHFGINSMRERVELLDGRFSIETAPGRGTSVRARFPLQLT